MGRWCVWGRRESICECVLLFSPPTSISSLIPSLPFLHRPSLLPLPSLLPHSPPHHPLLPPTSPLPLPSSITTSLSSITPSPPPSPLLHHPQDSPQPELFNAKEYTRSVIFNSVSFHSIPPPSPYEFEEYNFQVVEWEGGGRESEGVRGWKGRE